MAKPEPISKTELTQIETYLRKLFGSTRLSVRARPKVKDSAEVYVGDEFIATVTVDEEDGSRDFQFQMTILEMDLGEG